MKEALVVVDMQYDFTYGALKNESAIKIIPRIKEIIEEYKKKNADLYFTLDTHFDDYLKTREGQDLPVPHCIKGTKGHELVEELKPYLDESKVVLEKNTFGSTDILEHLKNYDRITFVGTCTDICVLSNVITTKAFFPEKEYVVISDACAGVTVESHNAALSSMKSCFVKII